MWACRRTWIAPLMLLSAAACGSPREAAPPPPPQAPTATSAEPEAEPEPEPEVEPAAAAPRIRVAITVDDLPVHGPVPPGATRLGLHQQLLRAFREHHVPGVYGFVNMGRSADLESASENAAALRAWVEAGHPLGNHTYSHPHLPRIGLEAYLAEIDRNDAALEPLVPAERVRRVFRYPYLFEGRTPRETRRVREHLAERDYRIAEVTIDFFDWAFHPTYARCQTLGDDDAVEALRRLFLEHAGRVLTWADETSRTLWDRPVPHILLLHVGGFSAHMIDALLHAYEARGVAWITLDEAMADPIYQELPVVEGDATRGTLIEASLRAREIEPPTWPEHPRELLRDLCPVEGDDGRTQP